MAFLRSSREQGVPTFQQVDSKAVDQQEGHKGDPSANYMWRCLVQVVAVPLRHGLQEFVACQWV